MSARRYVEETPTCECRGHRAPSPCPNKAQYVILVKSKTSGNVDISYSCRHHVDIYERYYKPHPGAEFTCVKELRRRFSGKLPVGFGPLP
jgi:hypothetical protein